MIFTKLYPIIFELPETHATDQQWEGKRARLIQFLEAQHFDVRESSLQVSPSFVPPFSLHHFCLVLLSSLASFFWGLPLAFA